MPLSKPGYPTATMYHSKKWPHWIMCDSCAATAGFDDHEVINEFYYNEFGNYTTTRKCDCCGNTYNVRLSSKA